VVRRTILWDSDNTDTLSTSLRSIFIIPMPRLVRIIGYFTFVSGAIAERNSCPARSCPRDGFQGQDCKCYCDSGSRSNPLMECGGNAVTTPSPVVVTTGSPLCSDNSRYCPSWARSGYCTGQYQNYMMANCKLSCNYCQSK